MCRIAAQESNVEERFSVGRIIDNGMLQWEENELRTGWA